MLIFQNKIVAKTASDGHITWFEEPIVWSFVREEEKPEPQILRDKCGEVGVVEDLWKNVVRTDWEAVMVKTSW